MRQTRNPLASSPLLALLACHALLSFCVVDLRFDLAASSQKPREPAALGDNLHDMCLSFALSKHLAASLLAADCVGHFDDQALVLTSLPELTAREWIVCQSAPYEEVEPLHAQERPSLGYKRLGSLEVDSEGVPALGHEGVADQLRCEGRSSALEEVACKLVVEAHNGLEDIVGGRLVGLGLGAICRDLFF